MENLLSVHEARQRVAAEFLPGRKTDVNLDEACGRVLVESPVARHALPPFSNSSMDGFAVRSADLANLTDGGIHLQVVGDIPAGSSPLISLASGQAARIMTGAPIPEGADAVVPVEQTDFPYREFQPALPQQVLIRKAVKSGENVRPRGQDMPAGQPLFSTGHLLRPQDIGLLAALGVGRVSVYGRPRIALLSTGDELTHPDEPLQPGKIYDSNSYMLSALARQAGAEVYPLGFTRDQPDLVRQRLDEAVDQKVDLILTSAGVSVGAFDYVRAVVEQHGQLNFWRVNLRPGKPLAFGRYQGTPLIGLPGNPVSAFVGFWVFVHPALRKLAGLGSTEIATIQAVLQESVESDGRETYLRGLVEVRDGQYQARMTGHQGSGNLFSLVQANALLIVPAGVKSLPAGSFINAWMIGD